MPNHIYRLLALLLSLLPSVIYAQSDIQLGISAYATAPITNNPSLGTGAAAEAWLSFPTGDQSIKLALGYEQLGGYQHGYESSYSYNSPWSANFVSERLELYRLTYLYAHLRYKWTWGRWGLSVGGRAGRMASARGLRTVRWENRSEVFHTIVPPEYAPYHLFLSGGSSSSGQSKQTRGQFRELMTGFDFGLNLMLYYELLDGLNLQAGYYQGLTDQWSDRYPADNTLYIQVISLGLSARIF